MAGIKCCALLVPVAAIIIPLIASLAADGRVWDFMPGWRSEDIPDLAGKVAIVTGPTVNGIGHESAVEMARRGAHVVLAGRSQNKGEEALSSLRERVPAAKAEFMVLDLASLKSVQDFAAAFKKNFAKLHILLNNAGVMGNPFTLTNDGLESQFATNHLGHFLLTKLLLPELLASAPSRVVTVSSAAAFIADYMAKAEKFGLMDSKAAWDFDHLGPDYAGNYSAMTAYGRSKLANVLFTKALAKRLEGKKVFANVCHPGGIDTNLKRHMEVNMRRSAGEIVNDLANSFFNLILMSPPMGAVTQLYLATSPEVEEKDIRGEYYRPQATRATAPSFATEALAEKLWEVSEKLVADYL